MRVKIGDNIAVGNLESVPTDDLALILDSSNRLGVAFARLFEPKFDSRKFVYGSAHPTTFYALELERTTVIYDMISLSRSYPAYEIEEALHALQLAKVVVLRNNDPLMAYITKLIEAFRPEIEVLLVGPVSTNAEYKKTLNIKQHFVKDIQSRGKACSVTKDIFQAIRNICPASRRHSDVYPFKKVVPFGVTQGNFRAFISGASGLPICRGKATLLTATQEIPVQVLDSDSKSITFSSIPFTHQDSSAITTTNEPTHVGQARFTQEFSSIINVDHGNRLQLYAYTHHFGTCSLANGLVRLSNGRRFPYKKGEPVLMIEEKYEGVPNRIIGKFS